MRGGNQFTGKGETKGCCRGKTGKEGGRSQKRDEMSVGRERIIRGDKKKKTLGQGKRRTIKESPTEVWESNGETQAKKEGLETTNENKRRKEELSQGSKILQRKTREKLATSRGEDQTISKKSCCFP